MLDWIRKDEHRTDDPMRSSASAAALLAELRGSDPVTALGDLRGWLDSFKDARNFDGKIAGEVLSLIQEAGEAHVSALLTQYLGDPAGKQTARESKWKTLVNYVSPLAGVLCASAEGLIKASSEDASLTARAAAGAVHALRACRTLAKICLVHYLSPPTKLWRLAYALHSHAEKAGCATIVVTPDSAHRSVTTAEQELLRLLMLQVSAPEMLTPEQVEVADRVTEQLGGEFTLRPSGVADNAFCFDPTSDLPPRRAGNQQAGAGSAARYFGPGLGLDALDRIGKQLASARIADIKVFGRDLSPHSQIATVQHLSMFWSAKPPYLPPAHSPATGDLAILHGFGQIWRHLSGIRSTAGELAIATDDDVAPQAPEVWELEDAGGNELGAHIAHPAGAWAKSGDVVCVSPRGGGNCSLGVIRRMHDQLAHGLHADIAVLSRNPLAVTLRAILAKNEDSAFSEASSRQFAFNGVRAIILSDGSGASQKPNALLPAESWKEGRLYEVTIGQSPRYFRGLQLLRRGDDYVRITFEWVSAH